MTSIAISNKELMKLVRGKNAQACVYEYEGQGEMRYKGKVNIKSVNDYSDLCGYNNE